MDALKKLFWVGIILSLGGCGKVGYDGLSDRCSSSFVSDYNDVNQASDPERQLTLAKAFREKYKGVKCQALVNFSKTTLDSDRHMDSVIRSLEKK